MENGGRTIAAEGVQMMQETLTGKPGESASPKRQGTPRILAALLLLATFGGGAWAGEEDEIITGCHHSNAEWGAEMIDRCIKENQATRKEVLQYPAQHKRLVDRCRQQNEFGWSHVKSCVDRDIEAEAALAQYPKQHLATIDRCAAEFAPQGAVAVKACVDKSIDSASAPKN